MQPSVQHEGTFFVEIDACLSFTRQPVENVSAKRINRSVARFRGIFIRLFVRRRIYEPRTYVYGYLDVPGHQFVDPLARFASCRVVCFVVARATNVGLKGVEKDARGEKER